MKPSAAALCVVSALISAASCLQCTHCVWVSQTYSQEDITDRVPFCRGNNYTCRSEEVCGYRHVMMTKYDEKQEVFIERKCIHPGQCNLRESFTTPALKSSYAITCCNTDKCTPPPPLFPAENNTKNGVLCPACYSSTKEKCVATHSMMCTGEEKNCITYERNAQFANTLSLNAMGCASKNVCKGNGFLSFLVKPKSLEEIKCTNVSNAEPLRVGHFLWCMYCHDYNVKNCSEEAFLCPPEQDICLFERTRSIYNNREEVEISKRCGKSNECSRAGSIRSSAKIIYMNTTCCDYSTCQAPLPDLPSANIEENGLTCPACYVPNSDRCLGRTGLKCTGNEQRCIHYMKTEVQEFSIVTESLHGCTTNVICEAGSGMYPPVGHYYKSTKVDIMCSRAVGWSAPLCTVLLSVSVIVLALVRPS